MTKSYARKWTHKRGIIRQRGEKYQVEINANGKRYRESLPSLARAKEVIEQKLTTLQNEGTAGLSLDANQRAEAAKAFIHLPPGHTLEDAVKAYADATAKLDGAPLLDAVAFYNRHHKPAGGVKTIATLLDEYVAAKRKSMRRARTIEDIECRIGRFVSDFGERHVHTVTSQEIDQWLDKDNHKAQTRINYLRVFSGFFNYARRQKLIEVNPVDREHIDRPTVDEHLPEIFPRASVEKLLLEATIVTPDLVPYLSIGFFAGLRTAELRGLDWACIDLDQKLITVRPETAKRRRQRHVDINDNLAAWLRPHTRKEGTVCPRNVRGLVGKVVEAAGIKWVSNGMRHTYASNHLARFQDVNRTMLQLGHVGAADVLFSHYRNLVRPVDAEAYWQIMPPPIEAGEVLVLSKPT